MVTTLYLIRHGATQGSGPKRYHGSIDIALSDKGLLQMQEAAGFVTQHLSCSTAPKYSGYLRDIHKDPATDNTGKPDNRPQFAAVYCSTLSRAIKSAEIIAAPHGLVPEKVHALRERSFGIWEGMSFTEIKEKYPAEFEAWAGNPLKYSPINGENTLEVSVRVVHALEEVLARHINHNIAIVAHGGVNRLILCHIMGIPLENIFRIEQDYAAVNVIEFWDKYPVVKLLNGGACG
jgi:broad specificity phosphatase PhoE